MAIIIAVRIKRTVIMIVIL